MGRTMAFVLVSLLALPAFAGDAKETKDALKADPAGWIELLTDKDLTHWKRVAIPPGSKLSARNPWSVSQDGKTLLCDAEKIHEMLLWDKEFGDGIFHVEWRFKAIDGKKGYNSGIYVRNSADGAVWHQAQVGSKNVGYLFGDTLMDGMKKRFRGDDKVPQRGKEAGEWNTYEITCKGKTIRLWVNGAVTATWNDCQVPRGHLGLEAEGYFIEFKNLKWKELPTE
jgi:3-keto-disaccharide hydrolase